MDAQWADPLSRELADALCGGARRLRLDLEGVDFMSSAGLRVLLVAAKRLKPLNGKIVLYSLKPQIREVFEIAGFTTIFPIYAQQEEAVRSFQ
ncbi:MAG: STAS domain-containing protein [Nitrospiraceae bacterium]